jgi:NAD(P)-dependent dehydrogenase (short-subunit alcohol dehydrogenase family)
LVESNIALRVPASTILFFSRPKTGTMEAMTTTLITGANKGLGRETARRLLGAGHDVWVGARNADAGQATADALGARFVQLDVTDDASVAAAAQTIRDRVTGLDVLINNAAIAGAIKDVAETTADDLLDVFATNVLGIVRVTHAFLPLLEESKNPVIVNVSSGMGSMTRTNDPTTSDGAMTLLAYPSSKSAVTMLTSQYARALPRFRINAADPGFTATDLNGNSGPQTVTEGTDAIVALATVGSDGPTNTFIDRHGVVPW